MNIIEKTYNWNGSLKNRTSTKRIILHHAVPSQQHGYPHSLE